MNDDEKPKPRVTVHSIVDDQTIPDPHKDILVEVKLRQ